MALSQAMGALDLSVSDSDSIERTAAALSLVLLHTTGPQQQHAYFCKLLCVNRQIKEQLTAQVHHLMTVQLSSTRNDPHAAGKLAWLQRQLDNTTIRAIEVHSSYQPFNSKVVAMLKDGRAAGAAVVPVTRWAAHSEC